MDKAMGGGVMQLVKVQIFGDGGKSLFNYDHLNSLNLRFNIDRLDCEAEELSGLFNLVIQKEQYQICLFDELLIMFYFSHNKDEEFGDINLKTLIISKMDSLWWADSQEIVLEHIAEQITDTFYAYFKKELSHLFCTWDNTVIAFRRFLELLQFNS